ncbi:PhzF family phenazine biosynthesis protein [Lysobacter korlensis]|uniref:PhzF family phenazine biosynthesis protein n=1 Tax=Lysobacter korlensis TaxID=553636 RepID=A0ABV6RSB7_9GAMM
MAMPEILRYTAFSRDPMGGNPAGVVPDASSLDADAMQRIARELGYSETAFLRPQGPQAFEVRYFSPEAEVPFCGHATIASAVALADRGHDGELRFMTRAGEVRVETARDASGARATLTSVSPEVSEALDALVAAALGALHWQPGDLDPALPARIGFAGARHLILATHSRERLAQLDYAFEPLRELMLAHELTTVALVWRESDSCYHVRNPFPVGGVVEDPATGAAAAAFGAYLRELGLVRPPATVELLQGADMGRPSELTVTIPAQGGIRVSGNAVAIAT